MVEIKHGKIIFLLNTDTYVYEKGDQEILWNLSKW